MGSKDAVPALADKIDIFTLGITLFMMMFHDKPFEYATKSEEMKMYQYFYGEEPWKFFQKHRSTKFLFARRKIDASFMNLILACFRLDPTKRPTARALYYSNWI